MSKTTEKLKQNIGFRALFSEAGHRNQLRAVNKQNHPFM